MDESKTSKKRSAVASSKLGATRCTNREKLSGAGDQLDKSQHSNLTPVIKRKFQKTADATPKVSSVYNLRSKDQITESGKSPSGYNLRSKVQKTESQNASTINQKRKTPKKDCSKDSPVSVQPKGILKNSIPTNKKIETKKPLTTSPASLDKNLTSQYEPFFSEPFYHIRWDGDDEMGNGPFGQNCIICNKDLSGVTEDDESEYNDDFQYEDDDDDDDEYYDDVMPPLLPAVDILACGHAYHTECLLQQGMPDEQSSDPKCVLCLKKA